jgi:hypothetical protein
VVDDDEAPWYRSLLTGVGALVGVALLVGGVVSLVTLGAVSFSGLGSAGAGPSERPSLYMPTHSPPPSDDGPGLTLADLNGGKTPSPSQKPSPEADSSKQKQKPGKEKKKPKLRSVISLSASPLEVSPMERIYLSGTYPGGEGKSLQVQRSQGSGWTDFPTSTSVSGGSFSSYVMTGRSGKNRFRVVDSVTGKKSNPVTVTVR